MFTIQGVKGFKGYRWSRGSKGQGGQGVQGVLWSRGSMGTGGQGVQWVQVVQGFKGSSGQGVRVFHKDPKTLLKVLQKSPTCWISIFSKKCKISYLCTLQHGLDTNLKNHSSSVRTFKFSQENENIFKWGFSVVITSSLHCTQLFWA